MRSSTNNKTNYTAEIIVVLGYLLTFCLASVACGGLFYYISHTYQTAKPEQNPYLVNLPSRTSVPHITKDYQPGVHNIFTDNFNDNQNNWLSPEEEAKVTVEGGKLFLESLNPERFATAKSISSPRLDRAYYIQADFSTNKITPTGFGLIFDSNYNTNNASDFFLFIINPESKQYFLYSNIKGDWLLHVAGNSDIIQAFPGTNTLGLYVNKNYLELYINRNMIDTYQTIFSFEGQPGFFVDGADFQLIVSNFTIDRAGGE